MEKDLIEYIAKSLVDDPNAVSVTETEGRIAKALRTVLSASANKDGKRYSLDILD